MMNQIKAFLKNEEGAETLEYVVIVAVIVGIAVTAYGSGLSPVIASAFTNITTSLGT